MTSFLADQIQQQQRQLEQMQRRHELRELREKRMRERKLTERRYSERCDNPTAQQAQYLSAQYRRRSSTSSIKDFPRRSSIGVLPSGIAIGTGLVMDDYADRILKEATRIKQLSKL